MIICYLCNANYGIRKDYIKHLRRHIDLGDKAYPAYCFQQGCDNKCEYYDLKRLNDHLRFHHENDELQTQTNNLINNLLSSNLIDDKNTIVENEEIAVTNTVSDYYQSRNINHQFFSVNQIQELIQEKIFQFIFNLKSKAQLSETNLNLVINGFNKISEQLLNQLFSSIRSLNESNNDNNNKINFEIKSFIDDASILKNPLKFIDSTYKQLKMIEKTNLFVKSKPILMGQRQETMLKNGKMQIVFKDEKFEYVSIKESLIKLLQNENISSTIEQYKNESEFEPLLFSNSEFWQNKKALRLLLYDDDLEVKNPIGNVADVYKITMFYYKILNLSRKHNSNTKNIFVCAAAFSDSVKNFGINNILEQIVTELKDMEINGFIVNNEKYYASVAQVAGDNLAIHQTFGLKCCFNGTDICHLCDASTETIQSKFNEEDFVRTTQTIYENQLRNTRDWMKECSLNKLKYFHHTNNYVFDIMHDIWEGIAPYELALILHQFIYIEKYFKLNDLNNRIKIFNYGSIEQKNKPNPIIHDQKSQFKLKIKQSATKMTCLFKMIPFLIGDKIPIENEHYQLYLNLSEIVDIIHSTNISLSDCTRLEWLVSEHHSRFKILFPEQTLRKKHHNMIHYSNSIRYLGNLIDYSSMRFEAKHPFIKTSAHTVHNCINILYSVMKKVQTFNCYNLYFDNYLNYEIEIISYREAHVENLQNHILKNDIKKKGIPWI
jgi:hypothetical protein